MNQRLRRFTLARAEPRASSFWYFVLVFSRNHRLLYEQGLVLFFELGGHLVALQPL